MSATGATPEQMETAIDRYAERSQWAGPADRTYIHDKIEQYGSSLVPLDHRIIGPEQIEALRRALGSAAAASVMEQSDFDLLFPLIGDEQ